MKKILAILSAAVLLVSMAACGGGADTPAESAAETSVSASETEAATERTTVVTKDGTIRELDNFSVLVPTKWSFVRHEKIKNRVELYNKGQLPEIDMNKTPMIQIQLLEDKATQDTIDADISSMLMRSEAKQGKDRMIGGYKFSVVGYQNTTEKKKFYVYEGLVDGKVCAITLRDISPKDENAAAVLDSITFH